MVNVFGPESSPNLPKNPSWKRVLPPSSTPPPEQLAKNVAKGGSNLPKPTIPLTRPGAVSSPLPVNLEKIKTKPPSPPPFAPPPGKKQERAQDMLQKAQEILAQITQKPAEQGKSKMALGKKTVMVTYSKSEKEAATGEYKVVTAEFELNGEKVQINRYSKGAYNGPKTQDFKDRLTLLHDAAKRYVAHHPEAKGVLEALKKLDDHYQSEMDKRCAVDSEIVKRGDKEAIESYRAVQKTAVELMGQYTRDIQEILTKGSGKNVSVEDLQKEEREYLIERGRPSIINIFEVEPFAGPKKTRQFVSIQEPAAKIYSAAGEVKPGVTLPSIARDRAGLANYVTTTFGEIVDNELQVRFAGVRHSSYPPIHIEDQTERQAIASHNCLQDIVDEAVRRHGMEKLQGTTKDKPIVVNLRAMMLLTAKKLDEVRNRSKFVLGSWRGESETTQLEDCVHALNLYKDRTFSVNVGGREVWIRPQISYMNLGTNAEAARLGVKGGIDPSPFQGEINACGICDFERDCGEYVKWQVEQLNDPLLTKLASMYTLAWRETDGKWREPIQSAVDHVQAVTSKHQAELNEKRLVLQQHYQEYHKADKPKKEILAVRIAELKTRIDVMEKEIRAAYEALEASKTQVYQNNRQAIREIQTRIEGHLTKLLEGETKPDRSKTLSALRNFFHCYLQAIDLYYTKEYETPEKVMEFQAHYMTLQHMMNILLVFFCKSAEDRTGRQENVIVEREIFCAQTGRYPQSEGDQKEVERSVASAVHQFSASLPNTKWNSEAPGLQIGPAVNPESLGTPIGKLSSLTWRQGWKKAEECKPSEFVKSLNVKEKL